ncbi:3-hydroxyanthranilic acid dioxygenase [Xylogone sp. PMI_703]|nr:3-hydroxyanthranilic acid dioxygenase [Xylogone sp. PMI_703]
MDIPVSSITKPIAPPISLASWLDENRDRLRPPVGNMSIFTGNDLFLQAIAGPNARNDYHINETEEWFYQLKGKLLLKIVENNDEFRDVEINEGEMFLLPGNTPHSPIREQHTIGLVMERQRKAKSIDRLRWYCPNASAHQNKPFIIREESFFCEDIAQNLKAIIEDWQTNEESRVCRVCGTVAPPH